MRKKTSKPRRAKTAGASELSDYDLEAITGGAVTLDISTFGTARLDPAWLVLPRNSVLRLPIDGFREPILRLPPTLMGTKD